MNPMQLCFLGTSAGLPTRERNVSGLALGWEGRRSWYLVDCGEGTQHRLIGTGYSPARLAAIFITHVHGDHCYGLPGLIASAQMHGRTEPLVICAPDGIEQFVHAVLQYTDVRKLRFPLEFMRSDAPDFHFLDTRLEVTAAALSHRVPSFAYCFSEAGRPHLDSQRLADLGVPRGPLWGALQRGQTVTLEDGRSIQPEEVLAAPEHRRKVIIAGDNDRPELLVPAMADADLLVHEATFTEDVLARVGPQYQHSTAAQVGRAAQQAGLRQLILTHFSQRYRRHPQPGEHGLVDLYEEAKEEYQGALYLAEDLASFSLDRQGKLTPPETLRAPEPR